MKKIQLLGLLLPTLIAGGACDVPPEDDVMPEQEEERGDPILNGFRDISNSTRTVRLSVGCTGVLLTNSWVLTANHCVRAGNAIGTTAELEVPGTTTQTIGIARAIRHPSNVDFVPHPPGSSAPEFQGIDVALLRTNRPFRVNGSLTGYRRPVWPHASADLRLWTPTCVGYGGSGNRTFGDLRVGGVQLGATRTEGGVTRPIGDMVFYNTNGSNQNTTPGDSGGGCFVIQGGARYVVSVNASAGAAVATSTPAVRNWINENI